MRFSVARAVSHHEVRTVGRVVGDHERRSQASGRTWREAETDVAFRSRLYGGAGGAGGSRGIDHEIAADHSNAANYEL